MNVFVLCTGRCGSQTFIRACSHITNFTAGHESRVRALGPRRLAYPTRHIEADNRLSWLLGRLDRAYGDDAFYVHLTRDRAAVARSYARRMTIPTGIMPAYAAGIHMRAPAMLSQLDPVKVAEDYVDTVTQNIEHFLQDKSNVMAFRLEEAKALFPRFWTWIAAEGDAERALSEFDIVHDDAPP